MTASELATVQVDAGRARDTALHVGPQSYGHHHHIAWTATGCSFLGYYKAPAEPSYGYIPPEFPAYLIQILGAPPEEPGFENINAQVVVIDATNGERGTIYGSSGLILGTTCGAPFPPAAATPATAGTSEAATDCQPALDHPELDSVTVDSGVPTLSGAFIVTLQQWTRWEESQVVGRPRQPIDNPNKLLAVCFIDGDFTAQTSGGQSHAERHRTRIVVLVYDGFVEPHMYGTKESIPVEDPAAMLPRLGVSNGTTLTVTLVVNGAVVATLPPRSGENPITFAALPPLPWLVEARSPRERVLVSMPVNEGDVHSEHIPGDGTSSAGDFGRVDLSCGRLDIWAGSQPVGPAPRPGTPGDCAP